MRSARLQSLDDCQMDLHIDAARIQADGTIAPIEIGKAMFGGVQHPGDAIASWKGLVFVCLAAAAVGGALVWLLGYAVEFS